MQQRLLARPDLLPTLALLFAGAAWGLFWIPMRAIEASGLEGVWATMALYGVSLLILFPVALWRWPSRGGLGRGALLTGLFTGSAFVFYATAFLLTDVVRVMILFYATPVWGTLLAWLLMGEKITRLRLLALLFGFGGLLVILGADFGWPWPRNLGDWMALLSGIAWAYGSLRLYRAKGSSTWDAVLGLFLSGFVFAAVLPFLPFQGLGAMPPAASLLQTWPIILATSALFFLPLMAVSLWGTGRLTPGRVGILFMLEVVVGVGSAALLTDEPFGIREIAGSLLILSAGLVELLPSRRKADSLPEQASP